MKHLRKVPILLTSILLASSVLAQTNNSLDAYTLPERNSIAAARSRYAQTENISSAKNSGFAVDSGSDGTTLAQLSRGRPGPPSRQSMGYPRGGNSAMWSEPGSGRHALIGAVIGFGLGAAIGAKGAGGSARLSVGFGIIGGAMGAAFGASIPSWPGGRFQRYRPWQDEDYDELGSASKTQTPRPQVPPRPEPSNRDRRIAAEPPAAGSARPPGSLKRVTNP